jgi:Ca2+-binding EF-hand superfamily protein
MIFDTFKKTFFAHLHQTFNISEAMQEATEQESQTLEQQKDPVMLKQRLRKLEAFLKDKFSKNWVSVRKAFLDLDTDHDGYISVEDVLRYFGTENEFSYQDLKKLMQDKDVTSRTGSLSYQDFSKWVGNYIHSV